MADHPFARRSTAKQPDHVGVHRCLMRALKPPRSPMRHAPSMQAGRLNRPLREVIGTSRSTDAFRLWLLAGYDLPRSRFAFARSGTIQHLETVLRWTVEPKIRVHSTRAGAGLSVWGAVAHGDGHAGD
jgi:hypothetical protein